MLGRVFRGKFVAGLKRAYRRKRLHFSDAAAGLQQPAQFHSMINNLFREDWVVYAKPAMGGAPQVLRYLGRYTHRVAISNHRLLAFDGERVTFRWKDYAHRNRQRHMTVSATEFLRRFVQHVLPRGFVRIRQFGFLANNCRAALLTLARQLLADASRPREPSASSTASDSRTWRCPVCKAPMRIGANLTAAQLRSSCTFDDSS